MLMLFMAFTMKAHDITVHGQIGRASCRERV